MLVLSVFEWPLQTGFTVGQDDINAAYQKIKVFSIISVQLSHLFENFIYLLLKTV